MKKRRDRVKRPNVKKQFQPKTRYDYIETDYFEGVRNDKGELVIRALTEEEKDWMDKFYKESVGASFKNDDTDLIKGAAEKKKVYGENNARNRCLYNIQRAVGRLDSSEIVPKQSRVSSSPEDFLTMAEEYELNCKLEQEPSDGDD